MHVEHPSVLTEREKAIAGQILKEIGARLDFLLNVGLDYLTLSRTASTLSGGEAQDTAGDADRVGADGGAVRVRRAVHRAASGGRLPADTDAEGSAGPGQHGAYRGARRGDHAGGGLHRGPGAGRGRARRACGGDGAGGGDHRGAALDYGAVPRGDAADSSAHRAARGERRAAGDSGGGAEQPEGHRCGDSAGDAGVRDGCVGVGEEHADQRDPVQEAGAAVLPGAGSGGGGARHRGGGAHRQGGWTSTSRRSGGRRAAIRRRTRTRSRRYGSCTRRCRNRGCAGTSRGGSRST